MAMRTLALLAAAVLVLPAAATAQPASDPKWNAWLGCWELVLENSRDAAASATPPARRDFRTPPRDGIRPQVCVQPAPGGATFSTRVGTQTPIEQTVIADGSERPMVDNDCRGTQRAEWSRNGRRLFASADLSCANDKGNRRVSGYSILGLNGTWTDIQAVDISGQQTVRVRRYRRVAENVPARGDERTPLSLDDIKEAGTKVSPAALEAAIVETGSIFRLSGKELLALQDAQVPGTVTDLIVALSYPDKFVVERRARADVAPPLLVEDPFFLGWAFGYPTWSDAYGFYSPLYGPYSPYFYSPFAYSYLRFYDPRYFGGGGVIVIGEGSGGGGGAPSRPSGAGRVVDGSGYTRVRPREVAAPPASQTGAVGSSTASAPSGGGSTSSSSGGGSVTSQGFSSGGGGDGGRTAQPR